MSYLIRDATGKVVGWDNNAASASAYCETHTGYYITDSSPTDPRKYDTPQYSKRQLFRTEE